MGVRLSASVVAIVIAVFGLTTLTCPPRVEPVLMREPGS